MLLATAGSGAECNPSLAEAKRMNAALVVCFIREVALSYKVEAEERFTLDTDPAAQTPVPRFPRPTAMTSACRSFRCTTPGERRPS